MPPPLGTRGIMFLGCPSVRSSIHPSVQSLKYPISTCMLVHPNNRDRFRHVRPTIRLSVCLPGEVFGPENAWREWPEIWHGDVSWSTSKLFTVTVYWFFKFWCYFDFVKQVKFGVSRHFSGNAWRKCPEIVPTDVFWPPSELISLWLQSVDFSNFGAILT